jgi:hypothetical protein
MAMSSPRMTSADPFEPQNPTFYRAMFQYGLFHVLTASRSIATTCRKEWGYDILINQNWKYGYLSEVGIKHLKYLLGWVCTD